MGDILSMMGLTVLTLAGIAGLGWLVWKILDRSERYIFVATALAILLWFVFRFDPIIFAVLLAIGGVGLLLYQQFIKKVRGKISFGVEGKVGVYLGPVTVALARWPLSFLLSATLSGAVYLIVVGLSESVTFGNSWQLYLIAVLIGTLGFGWPNKKLNVPVNTVAPMSFFGRLYRLYLLEGDYNWWGAQLLFAHAAILLRDFTTTHKDQEENHEPKTGEGFFKITRVPFQVWNSMSEPKILTVKATTKIGSDIEASLVLTLESFDPNLALRNDDPGLEIAERARASFRTAIGFFTGLDVALVKDVVSALIGGQTVVTVFATKDIGDKPAGSIVRDRGGEPLYYTVKPKEIDGVMESHEEALARTVEEYATLLDEHLTPAMKGVAGQRKRQSDGTYKFTYAIEVREVALSLNEILRKNGFKLISASVGTVKLDKRYSEAAIVAETQGLEQTVQVKSARATAKALEELRPTQEDMKDPTYPDRLALAAAGDPGAKNVQFNRVSGSGNPFTEAAAVIVGAGKKEKEEDK